LLTRDVSASLAVASVKDRAEAAKMLRVWLALSRRAWLKSLGYPVLTLPSAVPARHSAREWVELVERLQAAIESLEMGANVRITLESVALAFV
jgi:hypothetical protein